jgi:tRNA (guanine-N7-)-methyltransferase
VKSHETASFPAAQRLPLSHPDYRYSTSRNPYSAKILELRGRVYTDNETEGHRGGWRAQFPDQARTTAELQLNKLDHSRRELHVEIGCNAGHVVVEWAARNPDHAFIGIDWKFKPIFRGTDKAIKRKINNLIFLRAHADRLLYMFAPEEIDFLALYFPDPWQKKSQWKNRWLTAERLRAIAPLIRPGGVFHIKTDHLGYFEWMEKAVSQVGDLWEVVEHTRDLHAAHPDPKSLKIPEITLFEGLFIKDGIKINSFRLKRR